MYTGSEKFLEYVRMGEEVLVTIIMGMRHAYGTEKMTIADLIFVDYETLTLFQRCKRQIFLKLSRYGYDSIKIQKNA
jgi:hypothetical protein